MRWQVRWQVYLCIHLQKLSAILVSTLGGTCWRLRCQKNFHFRREKVCSFNHGGLIDVLLTTKLRTSGDWDSSYFYIFMLVQLILLPNESQVLFLLHPYYVDRSSHRSDPQCTSSLLKCCQQCHYQWLCLCLNWSSNSGGWTPPSLPGSGSGSTNSSSKAWIYRTGPCS